MTPQASALVERVWTDLRRDHRELSRLDGPRHPVPLPALTDVSSLAWGSVAAASLSAAVRAGSDRVVLDPDRIAVAYGSERWFRIDGAAPDAFAPLSGFFRTSDGWVRTHGNYRWHAQALRLALRLPDRAGRAEAATAFARTEAAQIAAAVTAAGGVCTPVDREDANVDTALRDTPLVRLERVGAAPRPTAAGHGTIDAPLRGIRVLDLTRVIAGPVATRTLALLGADVLRVDPPGLPEIPWQHLDSGHGKRSTVLDARSPVAEGLLESADVVVLGYRPAGLAAIGFSPAALAERHPGLVIAQLSAWGIPDQRGFDSIVQAASGISWIESRDGDTPGALPAQALDHSAGYLLAAGITTALDRRDDEGGSWLVETSLRRIAAELLGMPRTGHPAGAGRAELDAGPHMQRFEVAGADLRTVGPALAYDGGPTRFASPRPWGADTPEWRRRRSA